MNKEMLKIRIEKKIDHSNDIVQFRKKLLTYHSFDLANVFIELDMKYRKRIYEILSPEEFSKIFSYIDIENQIELIDEMHEQYISIVIANLPTDEACDLLKEIDDVEKYLKFMQRDKAATLRSLVKYDDDQAGSIMSTDYIILSKDMDVKDAVKELKSKSECEILEELFVLDDEKLVGVVDLKELIIARSPKKVEEIMDDPIYIESNDSVVEALSLIKKFELKALPVIKNEKMVGIISMDDWFDYIQDEANLDYNMMAGISFNDSSNGVFSSIKKRLPWLLILLILSLIVSTIISGFDRVIAEVSILVLFQSLVLDMGGNCGTQSLAVAVRNISNNKIEKTSNYLFKEFRIGLVDGVILGFSSFLVSYLFLLIRHPNTPIMVSVIVGMAMMITMVISTIMGAVTPLVFNKLKIDPAVASGPFISTLNDCLSVTIYYTLALLFINLLR